MRRLLLLLTLPLLTGTAAGQSGSPWSGVRPPGAAPGAPSVPRTSPATPSRPPTPPRTALSDTALVARVEGRPISRVEYDRLAEPYFQQLRAMYGAAFTPEVQRIGRRNVLKELLRREVLAVEASRQNVAITDAEIDSMLRRDTFFLTNGVFDPLKFNQFKLNPSSNYQQVLPQVREAVAVEKLDRALRLRMSPSPAAVRAEWSKRNDQVTFQYFPFLLRDVSLDPESTEEEWAAYHRAHPQEFERKTQLRVRAHRLPLPPAGDSTRAAAETAALARGKRMADSLAAGTLPDSAEGSIDTGLFEVPTFSVPALGDAPELLAELGRADTVASIRVVGPFRGDDAVIVGAIVDRKPRHVAPFREVVATAKRRADAEKRLAAAEAEQRAYYDAHPDEFRGPRAAFTRITLSQAAFTPRDIKAQEIETWYRTNGRTLFGRADTSKAWIPPLDDSLRKTIRGRIEEGERSRWLEATAGKLAAGLSARRNPRDLARANGAAAETLTLLSGGRPDSLFPSFLVDSLLASAPARKGMVQGPRRFGPRVVVWRVDSADTSFLPPFEEARDRVVRKVAEARRAREEADGRAWFDGHRDRYRVPPQRAIEYVSVAISAPDTAAISEAELRAAYEKEKPRFRQEEQVRARHILLKAGPGVSDVQARARAESLRTAAAGGAEFADLARRFSQEPGASASGGDLGWFGRGRMVKEFEAAAFGLAPGVVSEVVKTTFGYHVIRVEERKAAGTKTFDEVRRELRDRMAAERADSTAARAARALRRALAQGGKRDSLAAPHGGVRTTKPFGANEPAPGLGVVPGMAPALALAPSGRWLTQTFRWGRAYLVVRGLAELPERPAEFDDVKARAIEEARTAKREEQLEKKVGEIRAALAQGAALDSLAAPYGGLRSSGALPRSATFVTGLGNEPRVIAKAFELPQGGRSDTLVTAQGRVWIQVESRKQMDAKAFSAARAAIAAELLQKKLDEWLDARKKTMKVEVLRRDLREAMAEGDAMAGR